MNLSENGRNVDTWHNFVNFNQDFTCLLLGTQSGYRLYSLNSVESLDKTYDNGDEGVRLIERLYSSSLIAIVGVSSPCKLLLWHLKKGIEISSYVYPGIILALRISQQRLAVCLEECIYIHRTSDMQVLHIITDVASDIRGLCALSSGDPASSRENTNYLAYPSAAGQGKVQIFNTVNLKTVYTLDAHNNQLACIAFNSAGNLLATASIKGTIIRVFSIPDGAKLFEFRRGVKRCATIYSLTFSTDSQYLACSSNTETVHVYKLDRPQSSSPVADEGWINYIGKALMSSASYLPASEILTQGRDYAVARLPVCGPKNVCAVVNIDQSPRLLLASHDGSLYVFNLDPLETSSQCTLLKHHQLESISKNSDKAQTSDPLECGRAGDCGSENASTLASNSTSSSLPKWSGPARLSYASIVVTKHDELYDWQGREEREIGHAATTDCDRRRKTKTRQQAENNSLHLDDEGEFPSMLSSKQGR